MKYKKKQYCVSSDLVIIILRSKINTEVNNNVPDALPGRYVYNQNFFFKSTYLISAQFTFGIKHTSKRVAV